MGFDDPVDFAHEPDRVAEGDDDLAVVDNVLGGERAALAVLQPLLADLVAADVEVPDRLGDAAETGRARRVNAPLGLAGASIQTVPSQWATRPMAVLGSPTNRVTGV